jgi:curved DNA-binding protein CbpA
VLSDKKKRATYDQFGEEGLTPGGGGGGGGGFGSGGGFGGGGQGGGGGFEFNFDFADAANMFSSFFGGGGGGGEAQQQRQPRQQRMPRKPAPGSRKPKRPTKSGGRGRRGAASAIFELSDINWPLTGKNLRTEKDNVWLVEFYAPYVVHSFSLLPFKTHTSLIKTQTTCYDHNNI